MKLIKQVFGDNHFVKIFYDIEIPDLNFFRLGI